MYAIRSYYVEKFYNTVEDDPLKETDKNIIGEIYGAAMNAMRQE